MEFASTHLRCSVQIDLCALERNLKNVRRFLPRERGYIAFVPADAFGIGISAAVARLMESGADAFAVTNLAEAMQVRSVGLGWQIIVMSPSIVGEESFYFENDITPVLATFEEVERFEKAGEKLGKTLAVHMRLPLEKPLIPDNAEARKMLNALLSAKFLKFEAFCASGTGSGAKEHDIEVDAGFLKDAAEILKYKKIYIHHGDIFDYSRVPENFLTAIRIGLILFGVAPEENSILREFKPEQIMYFRTAISQIKWLPKGASVGYGNTYTLQKDTRIALISAGYGDGMTRNAGGRTKVLVRGKFLPIIGRVSMDQACLDTTGLDDIKEGDEVILIGKSGENEIKIEDYCQSMSIVAAQALCSITKRVPRYYKTLTY